MKKLLLIIMVLPFLGTGILNAQKLSKNDVFDILIKWEGKWKNSAVFEKSAWTKERNETKEREREESATDRWAAKNIQRIVRGNRGRKKAAYEIHLKNLRERLEILKAKAAGDQTSRKEKRMKYQVQIPENVTKEAIARGSSLQFTGNGGQTYTVKIPLDKKPGEIFIAYVRPKW